jgi:alkylated DNA nucleotide flippase Atl1
MQHATGHSYTPHHRITSARQSDSRGQQSTWQQEKVLTNNGQANMSKFAEL